MIQQAHSSEAGFSAVELLITLFIAVAFIASAYQLYSLVLEDSGETRKQSYASNVAYQKIRQYAAQATRQCSAFTPSGSSTMPTSNELANASATVAITCPYGAGTATDKVQVSIKYDTPQKEIVHAIYVNPN